jgi:toxin HigB-1
MLASYRCRDTERLSMGFPVRRFAAIEQQARSRIRRLEAATSLEDLAAIQGNRLESLEGPRRGQYSIRINDQWRICFVWKSGRAWDVEIVDYH